MVASTIDAKCNVQSFNGSSQCDNLVPNLTLSLAERGRSGYEITNLTGNSKNYST